MKRTILGTAILLASALTHAELAPMDEDALAKATGQSGLKIGITVGSADKTDMLNVDYSDAGFTMEAQKWEVDTQLGSATGADAGYNGGIIAQGISVAGGVDVIIDAVAGGGQSGTQSGLGISFTKSDISTRVDSVSTYSQSDGIAHSMGSFENIGMNLDGVTLTISGH